VFVLDSLFLNFLASAFDIFTRAFDGMATREHAADCQENHNTVNRFLDRAHFFSFF
jgi:hypothetical protein